MGFNDETDTVTTLKSIIELLIEATEFAERSAQLGWIVENHIISIFCLTM